MDDLISRQQSIDALRKMQTYKMFAGDDMLLIDQAEAQTELMMLPSAQPERLTDDDFETIRIHLNAYKEKLCNQQRWEEAEEYQRIIDRFMAFASAQPDTTTHDSIPAETGKNDGDRTSGDCISRTQAIDTIEKHLKWTTIPDYYPGIFEAVRGWLNGLPSAQPEQRWIPVTKEEVFKAGYEGREIRFRVDGRLFAIRELAQ